MIPTLILAVSVILLIVFNQAMRDIFPAQYKSFINSQVRKPSQMETIPFPRIQKLVSLLLSITYIYAAVLLIAVVISAFMQSAYLIHMSGSLCAGGGILLFFY